MTKSRIFTFGSNTAGRHGKGAALCALREHGAIYAQGSGLQGGSYAIPTKGEVPGTGPRKKLYSLSLEEIHTHVRIFLIFAGHNLQLDFQLTRIGCGLAGYTDKQIAPMFTGATGNVLFPEEWKPYV